MQTQKVVQFEGWASAKGRRKEANPSKIVNPDVIQFLKSYADAERNSLKGQRLAGEVYFLYFKADLATQREFITALCKAQRLPEPSSDASPRVRLVWAVYGADKGLLEKSGTSDTKAGKRISWALIAYKEAVGLKVRKRRKQELYPRKTVEFLPALLEAAKPEERALIEKVIARAFGKEALSIAS